MDVESAGKGVVVLAELDSETVGDVDEDTSKDGEELCEVASSFVTDAADAEAVAEGVCTVCSVADRQIVH